MHVIQSNNGYCIDITRDNYITEFTPSILLSVEELCLKLLLESNIHDNIYLQVQVTIAFMYVGFTMSLTGARDGM